VPAIFGSPAPAFSGPSRRMTGGVAALGRPPVATRGVRMRWWTLAAPPVRRPTVADRSPAVHRSAPNPSDVAHPLVSLSRTVTAAPSPLRHEGSTLAVEGNGRATSTAARVRSSRDVAVGQLPGRLRRGAARGRAGVLRPRLARRRGLLGGTAAGHRHGAGRPRGARRRRQAGVRAAAVGRAGRAGGGDTHRHLVVPRHQRGGPAGVAARARRRRPPHRRCGGARTALGDR
jgi:hypothetical protein